MIRYIALCLAIVMAAGAAAKDPTPKPMNVALGNFVTEALYCNAYFGFAEAAVRRQAGAEAARAQKLAGRLGQLAERALNLAITTGRRIERTPDQLAAQHNTVIADVKKMTNNSVGQLPMLIGKFDKSCKALIKKPEDRVQELFRNEFK